MSSPRPPAPIDAAHERHDALLISRFAAGDALDPSEDREARALVASCRGCARLAADLQTIAAAVAREPIPPRRRDFRIDEARAQQLRGSRWERLLRRLSVPQAGALRPAAAGVLSLGLLLVVAGSVWPTTEPTVSPASMPQASPAVDQAPEALPMPEQALDEPAPTMRLDDSVGLDLPAEAGAVEEGVDEPSVAKASTRPRERDTSGQHAFDAAEGPAEEAEPAVDREDGGAPAPQPTGATGQTEQMTMELRAPGSSPDVALGATDEVASGESTGAGITEPDETAAPPPRDETRTDVADGLAATSTGAATISDGVDVARFLIPAGIVLAVAGGILLVLAWLSRRAADPLLR